MEWWWAVLLSLVGLKLVDVLWTASRGASAGVNSHGRTEEDPLLELFEAALDDRPDRVDALVRRGANANACVRDQTPLHMAVSHGSVGAARALLAHGASPNARFKDWTPLMLAARRGDLELVRLLVDHGAEIDASDDDGLTPSRIADAAGHSAVVDLLDEGRSTG